MCKPVKSGMCGNPLCFAVFSRISDRCYSCKIALSQWGAVSCTCSRPTLPCPLHRQVRHPFAICRLPFCTKQWFRDCKEVQKLNSNPGIDLWIDDLDIKAIKSLQRGPKILTFRGKEKHRMGVETPHSPVLAEVNFRIAAHAFWICSLAVWEAPRAGGFTFSFPGLWGSGEWC